jgi:pimeloyl-ACP methyl ester carboxylesterase
VVWFVLGLLGAAVLVDLAIHVFTVIVVLPIFERKPPFGVEPALPTPGSEPVTIPGQGGSTLRGSLHRSPRGGSRGLVIFCPELGGNHWQAPTYCGGLLDSGFDVLSFDFRSQGESDPIPNYEPIHWLTEYEVEDVLTVIAYSRSRSDLAGLPVGLLGISRGGGAALSAAARCRDVACIACEGAFATESMSLHYTLRWAALYAPDWLLRFVPVWHLRTSLRLVHRVSAWRRNCRYVHLESELPRLSQIPVLMVAGQRDTYVHADVTRNLCAIIPSPAKDFWIVEGAKHNMGRQVAPEEYDRRLVQLFSHLQVDSVQRPAKRVPA